jgi:hypothetical protein
MTVRVSTNSVGLMFVVVADLSALTWDFEEPPRPELLSPTAYPFRGVGKVDGKDRNFIFKYDKTFALI